MIYQKGQSLIEIIIVMALAVIILPALLTGFVASREGKDQSGQRLQATALLKEAVEAVRSVREKGWSANIANKNNALSYYPTLNGSAWDLVQGTQVIDGFTRWIQFEDVYRSPDLTGDISGSGVLDPSTKKVTVRVSWGSPASTIDSVFYITRYLDSDLLTQTTDTDFNGGTHTGTVVTGTGEAGSVQLSELGPGRGDWCNPSFLNDSSLDLPRSGEARSLTAIEGQAFAGTGLNASGVSLARVSITNANPPISTQNGSFDGYKTNDVFGETGYAYLATDTNNREVVIVSTTSFSSPGKFQEIGSFNAPGNFDAESIFVSGNIGFVVTGSNLYTFNLTSKTGSRSQLGNAALGGTGTSVYVVGSYAYVSVDSTSNPLKIFEVGANGSLTARGTFSVSSQGGQDVYVSPDGNRAYLVASYSNAPSRAEFFIIDTTNKNSPTQISAYQETTGMSPEAVDMVLNGYRAIMVGTGGTEYQVLDIRNETNPVLCGSINENTGVYDVATVLEADGDAYAYITTGQASSEFKVLEGGGGGQFVTTGIFESNTLPTSVLTNDAAFNRLVADVTNHGTGGASLRFKVAVTNQVSGSCAGVTFSNKFTGPSGNPAIDDYYTDPGSVIIALATNSGYQNPGRCFRYRAYFTPSTDYLTTPVLNEVTINYSK